MKFLNYFLEKSSSIDVPLDFILFSLLALKMFASIGKCFLVDFFGIFLPLLNYCCNPKLLISRSNHKIDKNVENLFKNRSVFLVSSSWAYRVISLQLFLYLKLLAVYSEPPVNYLRWAVLRK